MSQRYDIVASSVTTDILELSAKQVIRQTVPQVHTENVNIPAKRIVRRSPRSSLDMLSQKKRGQEGAPPPSSQVIASSGGVTSRDARSFLSALPTPSARARSRSPLPSPNGLSSSARAGPADRLRVGDYFNWKQRQRSGGFHNRKTTQKQATAGPSSSSSSKSKGKLISPKSKVAVLETTGWNQQQPLQRSYGSLDPDVAASRMHASSSRHSLGPVPRNHTKRPWYMDLFRPTKDRIEPVLDSWWKWIGLLIIAPCVLVWFWCAVPFPKPSSSRTSPDSCDAGKGDCRPLTDAKGQPADANFWFFLLFYYGLYVAVALVYITQLFSLYRLNWWPAKLGAKTSYSAFWLLSIGAGYMVHRLGWDSLSRRVAAPERGSLVRDGIEGAAILDPLRLLSLNDDVQWQRKTLWVGLAFATMAMPALVCLIGLRRSGRQNYRHSLTDTQKAFLSRQLTGRIPASYIRFLWFIATIGLNLVALIAGQGYASVYLSTLPHTGLDGTAYVLFWMTTVNVTGLLNLWILEEKVRSQALLVASRYYYALCYGIFLRNLFARLGTVGQFAATAGLNASVCLWYPLSMSTWVHKIVSALSMHPKSWEEYAEGMALSFFTRELAQHVTMLSFLGWTTLLRFGSNRSRYPYFSFHHALPTPPPSHFGNATSSDLLAFAQDTGLPGEYDDSYTYQLTMLASSATWISEIASSFLARWICKRTLGVDITNLGLDEIRRHPELLPTFMFTGAHVLMDMLMFLVKLDFAGG